MTHSSFLISHSCLLGKQRELRHFPCDSIFRRFSLTSVEISLHDATHIFQAAKYHFLAEKNSNCLDVAYIYRLRNVFCIWRIIVIYITKNRNSKQIRVHVASGTKYRAQSLRKFNDCQYTRTISKDQPVQRDFETKIMQILLHNYNTKFWPNFIYLFFIYIPSFVVSTLT